VRLRNKGILQKHPFTYPICQYPYVYFAMGTLEGTPSSSSFVLSTTQALQALTTPWSYASNCWTDKWYYVPESTFIVQDSHVPGYSACQPPQVGWDSLGGPTLSPGVCPISSTINTITMTNKITIGVCCKEYVPSEVPVNTRRLKLMIGALLPINYMD
jgi:hypothetical protein